MPRLPSRWPLSSLLPLALGSLLACGDGSFDDGGLPPAPDDDSASSSDDDTSATADDDTSPPPDDADGDGFTLLEGDCDDTNASIFPGAEEVWDGIDTDCDGTDYPDPCGSTPPVVPVVQDDECQFAPPEGAFDPVVEWHSETFPTAPSYNQIMASPVVGNLSDDNGDGLVNAADLPDIAFTTYTGSAYTSAGYLRVWNGDGSGERWASSGFDGASVYSSATPAIGDVDGDGRAELLVATTDARVLVYAGDGTPLFLTASGNTGSWGGVALGDVDGDGRSEILLGRTLWNSNGSPRWTGSLGYGLGFSFLMDLDGDLSPEVVTGNTVYNADGSTRWTNSSVYDGFPGAADFNADGIGDVVSVYGSVTVMNGVDGSILWQTAFPSGGGGPPTVADYDGDGAPEVGVAGAYYYAVFDTGGGVLWTRTVQDYSSSVTGSSVFDFDGNGAAEVVYADEVTLWVYDGASGAVLLQVDDHASGTLYEYPVIADVDRDGAVEIVLTSNNYAFPGWTGVTVIGSAGDRWVSGRPIWNQHAYYITGISDDGEVTPYSPHNWPEYNSFRQGGFGSLDPIAAPNLKVEILGPCDVDCAADSAELMVRVWNTGLTGVGAGIPLSWYGVSGGGNTLLGTTLLPWGVDAGTASLALSLHLDVSQGPFDGILVVVDDNGTGVGIENECDETDNQDSTPGWPCDGG